MKINVRRLKNFFFSTYIALWCLTFHFLYFLSFGAQVCSFCVSPNFAFYARLQLLFLFVFLPLFIFNFSPLSFAFYVSLPLLLFIICVPFLLFWCFSCFAFYLSLPRFLCFFFHFFFAFCVSLPLLLSSLILPHPCGSLPGKFHLRGYYQRSRKMRKNVSSTLTNTTTLRLIGFQQQPQQNTKHDIQNTKVLQSAWGGKTPNPRKSHF